MLAGGTPYLVVADAHWMLDGSRRARPLPIVVAGSRSGGNSTALESSRTLDEPLPPDELRRVITDIRDQMSREIVGQPNAVASLALLGGLHVGAAQPRGGRALIIGSSGVGKSALTQALRRSLEPWKLPWVATDCLDLSSAGWSGAPSIGKLIEAALGDEPPHGPRGRRAVIVLDEFHHIRVIPGTRGNMAAKREEVLNSLLGVCGHGLVHLGEGAREYECSKALVLTLGAFTGLDLNRPVTVRRLAKLGIPHKLANRIAEEVVLLKRLPEPDLVALLRQWPALVALREASTLLGHAVRIPNETYARAARVITLGHDASTPRTAGGWLVSALRGALVRALNEPEQRELVIPPTLSPYPPLPLVGPRPMMTHHPNHREGGTPPSS